MNKINALFANNKDRKLLSLYFCAGCPTLEGTGDVIKAMERKGIDMIEVGIPFSDPLADGPVIQSAGTKALKNGMTVKKLFGQLKAIKDEVQLPLVLMGYLNPIMHYGIEEFFSTSPHTCNASAQAVHRSRSSQIRKQRSHTSLPQTGHWLKISKASAAAFSRAAPRSRS